MTSRSVSAGLACAEPRQSRHKLQCMLPRAGVGQVLIAGRVSGRAIFSNPRLAGRRPLDACQRPPCVGLVRGPVAAQDHGSACNARVQFPKGHTNRTMWHLFRNAKPAAALLSLGKWRCVASRVAASPSQDQCRVGCVRIATFQAVCPKVGSATLRLEQPCRPAVISCQHAALLPPHQNTHGVDRDPVGIQCRSLADARAFADQAVMTYISDFSDVNLELIATARFEIVNEEGRRELVLPFADILPEDKTA